MSPKSLMGSAAIAAALISVPAFAQQSPLPAHCMAFNAAARDQFKYDGMLSKTMQILKNSPSFAALQKRAETAGVKLTGLCARAFDPEQGLITGDPSTGAFVLNVTEVNEYGPGQADPAKAATRAAVNSGEVVYAMAKIAAAGPSQIITPEHDVETHAFVTGMIMANAAAEQVITVVDHAIRTGDESGINQAYSEHKTFAKAIGAYHGLAIKNAKTKTGLSDTDHNAFRSAIMEAAVRNGDIRAGLIGSAVNQVAQATMAGQLDPTEIYKTVPDSKTIGAALSPRLGQGVDAAKIIDDARAYWKAQAKDPALEALQGLAHIQQQVQKMKDQAQQAMPLPKQAKPGLGV